MALFVVLHHRHDEVQPWKGNAWQDDRRITAIVTPHAIGEAARREGRVFVHRCGWAGKPARVVCEANVRQVSTLGDGTSLVVFDVVRVLNAPPPVKIGLGTNYYEADPIGPIDPAVRRS